LGATLFYMSYRNCVYSNKDRKIYLWTWNEAGERVRQEHDFKPYILLEDKDGKEKSIYGTSLKKREFTSGYDRNNFIKDSNIKRIYENLPPYQQFLIDNYWMDCENDDFSKHPLKVAFLDLECPLADRFPEPDTAEAVINLLTIYDSESKNYHVFGLKNYHTTRDDVKYYWCKSEHDLLKSVIKYLRNEEFDVFTTWNGADFDIPYLVNRITFELGKEWADKLSPIGRIYERTNPNGKFGAPTKEYVIEGVTCADYLILYKKFNLEKQENNKLDTVGEVELGINKVEHEGNLWELARDDWYKYVDYNIRDVEILVKLDEKKGYISLLRFLAYTGLCDLENAIKTIPPMNGAIAIRARMRGEYIPTFIRPVTDYRAPGGYVAEPKVGFAKNIVSFDANSLYPSVMISLNLSPETKIGRVEKIGDKVRIHHVSGRLFEMTPENFKKFIDEEQAALSKAGFLFSQKRRGIVPEFLDNLYSKRKEMKDKMLKCRKKKDKVGEQKFDTIQYAYKIHLNSLYGYMLNKYAPMGDEDIGTSVTLTGQAVIKQSEKIFQEFLKKKIPNITEKELEDSYIYSDTDSNYLSLSVSEKLGIKFKDGDHISPDFFKFCGEIETYINEQLEIWAVKTLRSNDPRFVFKREAICDSGVFIAKKYYALHMLDDEGVAVDKFKYKGVDVVKTTMPKQVKPYVKEVIEHMIMTHSLKETNDKFNAAYEEFKKLSVEEISKISGMNNYAVYSAKCSGMNTAKGMPSHLKAAYFHDLIVEQNGWSSNYEKFKSGDKVRMVYVKKPNKYNIDMIGFKGNWPKEFNDIFTVDYETMFAKIFHAAIKRFYDAVGWKLRKPSENLMVELEDLFGI
jgi:DNA polymerase elongation subunit (family B)